MDVGTYSLTYQLEQDYWWYTGRRAVILSHVQAYLKEIGSKRARLLDYGCGTGLNLLHLSRFGDAYGMDASELAIHFCHARGIERVELIDPHDTPGKTNPFQHPFDLITLLDVLEHLPEDYQALQGLKHLLEPGGVLLVTVPAFKFLWSGEDNISHHLRRYTRRNLVRLFNLAGYKVLKASYFNFMLFPLQVASIVWGRTFHPGFMHKTILQPVPDRLNSILGTIFSLESKLLERGTLPIGGSILCIGQKES